MGKRLLSVTTAIVLFSAPTEAFESAKLLSSCSEPTSDTCIMATFEAARVEITRMGRADDLNEETGAPALLRSYLADAQAAAESIEDPQKRSERLSQIAEIRKTANEAIAGNMLMSAAGAAYLAIGQEDFDGYPAIGNAMVPDIMDLGERLLDWLAESQPNGHVYVEDNFLGPSFVGFFAIISAYQSQLGFTADAAVTLERFERRASESQSGMSEAAKKRLTAARELARLYLTAAQLARQFSEKGHASANDVDRFLSEHGADSLGTLAEVLSRQEIFRDAPSVIERIDHSELAVTMLARLHPFLRIGSDIPNVGAEELSAFAAKHWSGLTTHRNWLIDVLAGSGQVEQAYDLLRRIDDPEEFARASLSIYCAAPDTITPEGLVEFFQKNTERFWGWERIQLLSALARSSVSHGSFKAASSLVRELEDASEAAELFSGVIEAAPSEIAANEISAFLAKRTSALDDWERVRLVSLLAGAGHIDEARQLARSVEDTGQAIDAFLDTFEATPEELTLAQVEDFVRGRGEPKDMIYRSSLVSWLAGARRFEEAIEVARSIEDHHDATWAFSEIIALDPEAVSADEFAQFVSKHGKAIGPSYPGQSLVGRLVKAERFDEAKALASVIENADHAATAIALIVELAPTEIGSEEITKFLEGRQQSLHADTLVWLANGLVRADRLDEARAVIAGLQEIWTRVDEIDDDEAAEVLTCAANPMSGGITPLPAGQLLPELLYQVERESRPCARATSLANIGSALLDAREDR